MTYKEFIDSNTALLQKHGISTARLDCLVLLCDILNTNSAHLFAHLEDKLTRVQLANASYQISRRITHEPLAYIRKKCEFYGHIFYVDHRVLIPRPESEAFIDMLRWQSITSDSTVIDVGTGSGALAITAKTIFPAAQIMATDIDSACLDVARINATHLGAKVSFYQCNLLDHLDIDRVAQLIILANLPYVPTSHPVNTDATYEPKLALYGGTDGLDYYRLLFDQLVCRTGATTLLTESLPEQHKKLEAIARNHQFVLEQTNGLVQLFLPS